MAITFSVNEKLIEEACAIGKCNAPKEVIKEALREYIQRRKQVRILDLFNTIDYSSKYNYKRQRRME